MMALEKAGGSAWNSGIWGRRVTDPEPLDLAQAWQPVGDSEQEDAADDAAVSRARPGDHMVERPVMTTG